MYVMLTYYMHVHLSADRPFAVVDLISSLGSDSVLENGPSEEVAEMAPGTPDMAKEAMVSDVGDVSVLVRMVSAEDRISVCR